MRTWSASTCVYSTRLESACIAKNEARRRECEDKTIGKQVQLEKIKQKDTEEQLKRLKPSAPFAYIPLNTNPMQTRRLTQHYNDDSELQHTVQLTCSLRLPLPALWDCASLVTASGTSRTTVYLLFSATHILVCNIVVVAVADKGADWASVVNNDYYYYHHSRYSTPLHEFSPGPDRRLQKRRLESETAQWERATMFYEDHPFLKPIKFVQSQLT
ncbi:hypothetical protein EDB85DRAFT_1894705 [Lactarius pseudohatsudake]|nr:hypothetical protein EDB85DRAFT_1894705 [Lactarius pseudohatsudake]